MPECEAECRNRQALHVMAVDWGNGVFDYGKIRAILAGRVTDGCHIDHCLGPTGTADVPLHAEPVPAGPDPDQRPE